MTISKSKIKTIFISTGEVSGDLQGGLLINALKRQAKKRGLELNIVALGGNLMEAAGATLLGNTTKIGSVGIIESIPYILPTIQVQNQAKKYLRQYPPDIVILIDYIGPNLGIGSYLKAKLPLVPLVYYIAPQVWVWSLNQSDTNLIIKIADLILAIFPEEYRYFKQFGANITWVGHPLLDRIQNFPSREVARKELGIESDQIAIALLPASRLQELKYLMPAMFKAASMIQKQLPKVHFWIPVSLETYRNQIEQAIKDYGLNATAISGATNILAAADLAITKSGTVNLELALLNVPQVVIYRVNQITAWIAEHILKVSISFMSPPNLVVMRSIIPELMQDQASPANIFKEAMDLLLDPILRQKTLDGYQEMRQKLGEVGVCDRAADEILEMINDNGE